MDDKYIYSSSFQNINGHQVKIHPDILLCLLKQAKKSTCERSKCGSVIIASDINSLNKRNIIIGLGYNSMPFNVVDQCFKDDLSPTFKSDKTCCVHAEQRAIMDMLSKHENFYTSHNSTILLFIRLNENDEPKYSGEPYCSICSKMALDAGINYFGLWREHGWDLYETKEYNELTFKYNK